MTSTDNLDALDTSIPDAVRPGVEFVYRARAALGDVISIGDAPDGNRRIIPIISGQIEGPRIRAEVLGGGCDWQVLRADGVTVADATYAARTHDGTIIQIRNRGLRHGPAAIMQDLASGKDVHPSKYYFRTVPEFIAPTGEYDWLNKSVFICSGARYTNSIELWVWRVT